MSVQLFTQNITGIDFDSEYIRMVHLRGSTITAYGAVAVPRTVWDTAGNLVDPAAVSSLVKKLARELGVRGGPAVTGLSGQRSLIRRLDLPLMPPKELEQALRWQVEEVLPFPLAEAQVDYRVVQRDIQAKKQAVLLVAGPQSLVHTLRDLLRTAGFRPRAVEVEALALCRSAARLAGRKEDGAVYGILNLGRYSSSLVLAKGAWPLSAREMPIGSEQLSTLLPTGRTSDPIETELTAPELRNFLADIYRNLRYLAQQPGDTKVETIFLCGTAAEWSALAQAVTAGLGVDCRPLELTPVITGRPRTSGDLSPAAYCTAYGYAAWALKGRDDVHARA